MLHIGAGTGYYTAILAELAGSVDAYEIEASLAARAVANLAAWPNVTVHAESATGRPLPEADAIYVSAGATHPDPFWLDALREGGRLLFPLTGEDRLGRHVAGYPTGPRIRCPLPVQMRVHRLCGLARPGHCRSSDQVFRAGGKEQVRSLTRAAATGATIWFAGDGWYLSTDPPASEAAR